MNVLLTPFRRYRLRVLLVLLGVLGMQSSNLLAQCSLACRGTTNLSLDTNCEALVTPMMILEDEGVSCPAGIFRVEVEDNFGIIPTNPVVTGDYIGKTLKVSIIDDVSGNRCWGYLLVEDKLGPVIVDCPVDPLIFSCSKFEVFPGPQFMDSCEGPVEPVILSETVTPLDCDPDYIKEVVRVYTAYDSKGMEAEQCTVTYLLQRIDLDLVVCPKSYTIVDDMPNCPPLNCDGTWDYDSDCTHANFEGVFTPGTVDINGPGGGTNGYVDLTLAPHSIGIVATTDGIETEISNTDLCYTIPCDGFLMFDWTATMLPLGTGQLVRDEPAYVLNGVETILPNATQVVENAAAGLVNIPVSAGDEFCFRVRSMNRFAYTVMQVSNLLLSEQCGLELDTDTNGDGILDAEANGRWDDDNDGYPDPYEVGVPRLCGLNIWPMEDLYCNAGVFYNDIDLPSASECKRKIMRQWEIREWWCGDEIIINCFQIIEIVDDEAPEILCLDTEGCIGYTQITTNTSTYGDPTHGPTCGAEYYPPLPTINDNCSSTFEVDMAYPGGFVDHYDGSQPLNLEMGINEITVTVYDNCYNSSQCTIVVDVVDDTPPVAICDQYTAVSLTTNDNTKVYAETFDDGSHDDCLLKKHLVRRMDPCGDCDHPVYPDMIYLGEYNGHHYYHSKYDVNWYKAYDLSEAMGGYLARIGNSAENAWVADAVAAAGGTVYYVDYLDDDCDNQFTLNSGSNSYARWGSGQPSIPTGRFAHVSAADQRWYTIAGQSDRVPYVMEVEDPCTFSHKVKFCCDDVSNDDIMVIYRAVDAYGNYNDCMVNVDVQDKHGPTILCPDDQYLDCDIHFDPNDLGHFGEATAVDNCENPLPVPVSEDQINQCGIGQIIRTFTVTDDNGNSASCQQVLHFNNPNPFDGDDIVWPDDYDVNDCDDEANYDPSITGTPTYPENFCALVGTNYTDEVFFFNENDETSCFKIIRQWRVIDWCQTYDHDNNPNTPEINPIWEYYQTIKVNNFVAPTFTDDCEEVWVCTYDPDCQSGPIELTKSATDDCTLEENLSWHIAIDLYDDGSFDEDITTTGGTADISGVYPVGKHKIKWKVTDKCGNFEVCEQVFKVQSCKAPTPYCINGLATDLMPVDTDGDGVIDNGMIELWASDFDLGSFHPCGYDVVVSFEPDITIRNMVFDCDPLGENQVMIYATAVDANGDPLTDHDGNLLQAFCNTYIDIQDNMDVCPDTGGTTTTGGEGSERFAIDGTIATEDGRVLEDVMVILEGANASDMSDDTGFYAFADMPEGSNYIINPDKEDIHRKGVTTLDIILIQRHILNLEYLTSPYKIIAADANKDKKLTAADIVEIRKLILEYIDQYSANDAWRFVDAGYAFTDVLNPLGEEFTEDYLIYNLDGEMHIDFIAMKIGDVNTSVELNVSGNDSEVRSSKLYGIEVGDFDAVKGTQVSIPFYAESESSLEGLQMALTYQASSLTITGVSGGAIDIDTDNYRISDNMLWMSVDASVDADAGEALFYVDAVVNNNSANADQFTLVNAVLANEVYNDQLEIQTPILTTSQNTEGYVLYQNSPNPFKNSTQIDFRLPEATKAKISVRDITGKLVYTTTSAYSKGLNSITIEQSQLQASGVLYYTLETNGFTATRKMVVIE